MLFIGHTRYSLFNPRSASWRATNGTRFQNEEEYRQYLYSDERMDLRERIFLGESVPSLALASRGYNYKHVVSFSESLPEKRKAELRRAAEDYPFIVLDEHSPSHSPIDLNQLAKETLGGPGVYGVFRLDDDDILGGNFFRDGTRYLNSSFVGMQVSFPRGIEALWDRDEISFMREAYFPMLALGLLTVCEVRADGSVDALTPGPHTLSDRFNPVVLDARNIAYVRYNHITQDTAISAAGNAGFEDIAGKLLKLPELKVDSQVEALFPVLEDRFANWLEYVLFKGDALVTSELRFSIPPRTSSFRVALDATFTPKSRPNSALVKLDLRDEQGERIEPALVIPGIGVSPNPNVGHYRYLEARPGRNTTVENFVLPPNIKCHGISLMPWGQAATDFEIHNVSMRVLRS